MAARVGRLIFSKLMIWIAVAIIGVYFLFNIDIKKAQRLESDSGRKFSFVEKMWHAVSMPRLKLGIDLQGGTYLVLGVEVDKAIDSRLKLENKNLDPVFKTNSLNVWPVKREVVGTNLVLSFNDENDAKVCFNLIKREVLNLKTSLKGLDVVCELTSAEEQRIRLGSVEQAVNVLSNRLSGFGVEGIVVQQHGEKQIIVQLPGVDDPERVKSVITKTAKLDFKLVEKVAKSESEILDAFDGELPSDKMIIKGKVKKTGMDDETDGVVYLVSAFPDLTGDHIVDARVTYDQYNKIAVSFKLDSSGAGKFRELTGGNIGKSLGIIIDNIMYSAPTIQSEIGGQGQITGNFSPEDGNDLALVLRSGALVAPIKFEQETRVGASLGQDSIRNGILACILALLVLFVFSVIYYKVAGIFAVFALIYNMFLILLLLSYFDSALVLSGIAGMVLTIGMAIDASILIYEGVKEQLKNGVPFRKALDDGFKGAMVVILDSNITTFLTGLVLFKFGGPVIRGFAVTLMIGIIATVLSGVYFLKAMFDFVLDNTKIKSIKL
ncbi:MAG: Protein translocase subunit SecD [candidate division TM6 bacterium GW2011_GWF2_28_16]|nr:MAG: Protein translocase subunit SecD [candidate division TM6 bacterium GW2011_GWF2_28_16]